MQPSLGTLVVDILEVSNKDGLIVPEEEACSLMKL
jgi:hypothetical protein